MATHSYTSTPLQAKITSKPLSPPALKPCSLTAKHLRTTRTTSLPRISVSVSAAAATSFEVKDSSVSTQPSKSKSLPFRVGHGFDLHRLEPGYPLIIGGIDIPHDRGCEAHSDGMQIVYVVSYLQNYSLLDLLIVISNTILILWFCQNYPARAFGSYHLPFSNLWSFYIPIDVSYEVQLSWTSGKKFVNFLPKMKRNLL